jgi:hypothetical protein
VRDRELHEERQVPFVEELLEIAEVVHHFLGRA